LFSLFCYMPCLLLGRLAVSAGGDVLQSCSFGLAFSLYHLHMNPLPALSTTHVAKLLAYTATRPCAVAIHIGIQHCPSTMPTLQILHYFRLFLPRPDYVRLPLLVLSLCL
jgi:hypothetical protein